MNGVAIHFGASALLPAATKLWPRLCFSVLFSVILFTEGGVLSQHALEVVSEHALQQVSQGSVCSQGVSAPGGVSAPRGVSAPGGSAPRGCLLLGSLLRGGAWSGSCDLPLWPSGLVAFWSGGFLVESGLLV